MKTNFNFRNGLGGQLRSAGAALFLLSGFAALGQPFASPVGPTWDVVMSGPRDAVALMIFNDDQTISMTEVLVPKAHQAASFNDIRAVPGSDSRDGSGGVSNGLPAHVNIFGWFSFPSSDFAQTFMIDATYVTSSGITTGPITNGVLNVHAGSPPGQWGFDTGGRVVGYFTELSLGVLQTNTVQIGTNAIVDVSVAPNVTNQVPIFLTNVTAVRITNAIQFTAKVTVGKRLTAVLSTPDGKATLRGLPPLLLKDISGSWYGTKIEQGLPYNEFFDLEFPEFPDAFNMIYDIDGNGSGYSYTGGAIVSRQNKIGLVVSRDVLADQDHPADGDPIPDTDSSPSVNPLVRAEVGTINLKHGRFTSRGIEGKSDAGDKRNSYKAVLSPVLP
ncbi:MAG: hypothetical protein QOJ40_614 [Verrucomicrobiota bacterium]